MLLNGGKLAETRILSRKSVELLSQNHIQGKSETLGYGLGFGVNSEAQHLTELGSMNAYYWGGFFYTSFVIDPKEDMIAVFMGQLHPTGGLNLDAKTIRLAYQAINDWAMTRKVWSRQINSPNVSIRPLQVQELKHPA